MWQLQSLSKKISSQERKDLISSDPLRTYWEAAVETSWLWNKHSLVWHWGFYFFKWQCLMYLRQNGATCPWISLSGNVPRFWGRKETSELGMFSPWWRWLGKSEISVNFTYRWVRPEEILLYMVVPSSHCDSAWPLPAAMPTWSSIVSC